MLTDNHQITTHEQHLHLAAADGAPGFEILVEDIVKEFGTTDVAPAPVVMDDYNSDWDSIYPFSAVSCSNLLYRRVANTSHSSF